MFCRHGDMYIMIYNFSLRRRASAAGRNSKAARWTFAGENIIIEYKKFVLLPIYPYKAFAFHKGCAN